MGLPLGTNFELNAEKFNFERDSFATLAEMKAFPLTSVPDGFQTFCEQDFNHYIMCKECNPSEETGHWRNISTVTDFFDNPVDEFNYSRPVAYGPWREDRMAIVAALGDKVNKVAGKGLSTNDYTTTEKQKLSSLTNYDDSAVVKSIKINGETKTPIAGLVDLGNVGGGSGASKLSELDDVSIVNPTNGQVPAWNSVTQKFENKTVEGGVGGSVASLNDVGDVDAATAKEGDVLALEGGVWKGKDALVDISQGARVINDPIELTITDGMGFNAVGAAVGQSACEMTDYIKVEGPLLITAAVNQSNAVVVGYDYLKGGQSVLIKGESLSNSVFIAPEGIAYIRVSNLKSAGSMSVTLRRDLLGESAATMGEVSAEREAQWEDVEVEWIENAGMNAAGSISLSSTGNYLARDILIDQDYIYRVTAGTTATAACVYANSSAGHNLYGTNSNLKNQELVFPFGCVTFRVCSNSKAERRIQRKRVVFDNRSSFEKNNKQLFNDYENIFDASRYSNGRIPCKPNTTYTFKGVGTIQETDITLTKVLGNYPSGTKTITTSAETAFLNVYKLSDIEIVEGASLPHYATQVGGSISTRKLLENPYGLYGKKLVGLGDSITAGAGPNEAWFIKLTKMNFSSGISYRDAISGQRLRTMADRLTPELMQDAAMCLIMGGTNNAAIETGEFGDMATPDQRYPNTEYSVGDYVVGGVERSGLGENVWCYTSIYKCVTAGITSDNKSDIGNMSITDQTTDGTVVWEYVKETTHHGDLRRVTEKIYACNTDVEIVYIKPIRAGSQLNIPSDKALESFTVALKDHCDRLGIPLIDMAKEMQINKYNSARYLYDGLHPGELGHRLFARIIARHIGIV